MKRIKWIGVISKKILDPYQPKNYAWLSFLVPPPTSDLPYACVLVSVSTGKNKTMMRLNGLLALKAIYALTEEEDARLTEALTRANHEADRIETDMRLLFQKRHLAPGSQIVRTDTGEVIASGETIAEAERYLKEKRENA